MTNAREIARVLREVAAQVFEDEIGDSETAGILRHVAKQFDKGYDFRRCGQPAQFLSGNGVKLCLNHLPDETEDLDGEVVPDSLGPCDYLMDGLGGMTFISQTCTGG